MDNRTTQLGEGVWQVEVGFWLNAFVLADDGRGDGDGLTLIDTGWRSGGPRLVRSLRMAGLDPRAVRHVVVSHWHADHAGSAARFARSSAAPCLSVGPRDLPVVAGQATLRPRPPAVTRLGRLVAPLLRPPAPVPTARPLQPGTVLDTAGGCHVVAAPGHTPGHLAFHIPSRGLLLAGDAVFTVFGLRPTPRFLCSDVPAVPDTLASLASLQFDTLAVGHGPAIVRRARERLAALSDSLAS